MDDEDLDFAAGSAIAVEKEVAADALLEIFRSTRQHFLPYVETVVKELLSMLEHFWDGIRKAAATTLLSYIATFNEMSELPKWTAGLNPTPLPQNLQQLVDAIIPPVMEMWEGEEDRDVVNSLCEDFQVLIEKVGPAVIVPQHLDGICNQVLQILEKKAPCQLDTDEEEAPVDQPAEQSEYDALLICSACDLVAALAKAVGPDFGSAFGSFFPEMAKYYVSIAFALVFEAQLIYLILQSPTRTVTERSTAVGALAEVAEGMGPNITSYTPQLLQIGLAALADADSEVTSNAAFLVGTLVSVSSTDLSGQYSTLLGALEPLFYPKDDKKESIRARDNACGAIARMVTKNQAAVPLERVLPPIIAALPFTQDTEPYTSVFEMFFTLFAQNNQVLLGSVDQLLPAFGKVLEEQRSAKNEAAQPLAATTHASLLELVKALPGDKVQAAGLQQYL